MFNLFNNKSEISRLKKELQEVKNNASLTESSLIQELREERRKNEKLSSDIKKLEIQSASFQERLKNLQKQLDNSKSVKYASARKTMNKTQLKQLRASLEAAPDNAEGFGGSSIIYDKKTKRLSIVEFTSKLEALDMVKKAEKGDVDIVF